MIELRALGTLVLRTHDGEDILPVLAQPKRVALLAYLAAARPVGFHRRDTLLALLWPEQDEQHARWALNQALRHLRSALGHRVVVSRGDGEVGIDPEQLSCDVVQFATAIAGKDPASALELYRGDLLQGFHISGCGEFERWLDEERTWLRGRAVDAASTLAERTAAAGELVSAGQWARRTLAFCPHDEGVVRRLIELLGRVGDRAGAVQAYEEFARRLRQEYEVEPAPETRALIAAVRTRQGPAVPTPAGTAEQSKSETFAGAAPAQVVSHEPVRRRRRLPAIAAIGVIVLSTAAAVVWSLTTDRPDPAASGNASTVAVLPFMYRGASEFAYLGEGMVDLLSAGLSGAGDIRTIEPLVVQSVLGRQDDDGSGLARAQRVAVQVQAGSFVVGEIVEVGGNLRITARIHRVAGSEESPVTASVQGPRTQLFQLLDQLVTQLIAGRSGGPATRLIRMAALTTDSLGALKAYLQGERHFRDGKSDSGVRALEQAVRIDSSFALAHYRLASMAMWSDQQGLARASADRAVRLSRRLNYRDRQLIEALAASLNGRVRDAQRIYGHILSRNPDDVDANYQFGDLIFHHSSLLGRSWLEAREPLERVLAIDPDHESSLYHLTNITARERRLAQLDSLTERVIKIVPPQAAKFFQAQRAIAFGDTPEIARFLAVLEKLPEKVAQQSGGFLVFTTGNLEVGRRIWRSFAQPSRSSGVRVLAHMTLAKMELMSGRWRAAKVELEAGKALDPATALEHRALLSLWPLLDPPRAELVELRESLLRWKPGPGRADATGLTAAHEPARPYLRRYLLGLLEARLGDEAAALGHAIELDRLADTSFAPSFVRDWARTVRAEVARAHGSHAEALAILDTVEVRLQEDLDRVGLSPFYSQEYKDFARAELLESLGREEDALWDYGLIADALFHSGAPAHFRMAQIYDRRGERQKAAQHYARFAELWKDCDPELQPLVERAKRSAAG